MMDNQKKEDNQRRDISSYQIGRQLGQLEAQLIELKERVKNYQVGLDSRLKDTAYYVCTSVLSKFGINSNENIESITTEKENHMDSIYIIICYLLNHPLGDSKEYIPDKANDMQLYNDEKINIDVLKSPQTTFFSENPLKEDVKRLQTKINKVMHIINTFIKLIFSNDHLQQGHEVYLSKDKQDTVYHLSKALFFILTKLISIYADIISKENKNIKDFREVLNNCLKSSEFNQKILTSIYSSWSDSLEVSIEENQDSNLHM